MFRTALSRATGLGLAQRTARQNVVFSSFHTTAGARSQIPDTFANKASSSSSSSSNSNSNDSIKSLFGHLSKGSSNNSNGVKDFGLINFSPTKTKANTTANPIHLDANHPTQGRSFRVNGPHNIDQTYRRLRTALNQSNIKLELRRRRAYETGHVRMRRENQERNKKLFGAMVRKKIELIGLMKIRGM
ncbi:hypothetical protein BGZ94_007149 [Podila epigama]|nr:hypothetical protein BGZ94_007149 [Podila epigama]